MAKLIRPAFAFLVALAHASDGPKDWRGALSGLWSSLAARHAMHLSLGEHELAVVQGRLDQIQTQHDLSQQSELTITPDGNTAIASDMRASLNDWGVDVSLNSNGTDLADSRVGAFHTFFSGRGGRIELLDSIKFIARARQKLEWERLLLADWKAVLLEKIAYDVTDAEIGYRRGCLDDLSEVEGILGKLRDEGEVSANILTPIALFRMDTQVRIRTLEAQQRVQLNLVRSHYSIPESLFLDLMPDSLESLVAQGRSVAKPYEYSIDSLLVEENRKELRLSSLPKTGLDLGLGLDVGQAGSIGIYATTKMDFSWWRRRPLPKSPAKVPWEPAPNPERQALGDLTEQVKDFEKEADKLMQESLEKIRLGKIGSALEITDMILRKFNQKTQLRNLLSFRTQATLALIENLDQVPIETGTPN